MGCTSLLCFGHQPNKYSSCLLVHIYDCFMDARIQLSLISFDFVLIWRRTMLQSLFEARRTALKLGGRKFPCPWCCLHDQSSLIMWATPQTKYVSKSTFKLRVRYTHHLVNELWSPLKLVYGLQIWELQSFHMCILTICKANWTSSSIMSSRFTQWRFH